MTFSTPNTTTGNRPMTLAVSNFAGEFRITLAGSGGTHGPWARIRRVPAV